MSIILQNVFFMFGYFSIGLTLASLYIYFFIPYLREDKYNSLMIFVVFWPIVIPILVLFFVSLSLFQKIDKYKKDRLKK